jgi:hypothetical protein
VEQLWAQVCQTKITMSASKCRLHPLDFITTSAPTSDTTLHSDRQPARFAGLVARELMLSSGPRQRAPGSAKRGSRHGAAQATDSASRSREEITVETPSPRMLTP